MVIKGDALLQVMGDWAKGEFKAAGKKSPAPIILCPRFPGTDGSGDLQLRHVRHVRRAGRPQGRPGSNLPTDTLSKSFPGRPSTSSRAPSRPARTCRTRRSTCAARRASPTSRRPTPKGTLFGSLAQGYGAPPAVANAYKDVVTKFVHGEIKTSDEAVKRTRQGARRRQVTADHVPFSASAGDRWKLSDGAAGASRIRRSSVMAGPLRPAIHAGTK